ncbi:MAG: LysR family transcriptional regulator [Akkermansiaceae bacterium]|nr:LysR family transcriptional regulator [Akkermansiaceae bacterium]
MNLEHLRHFLEVTKDMNISAAARRVRLTQPALSRQMVVFENDTGWSLFHRGAKSIKLTRDGEIVKRLGREMIDGVDLVEKQMRREIEGEQIRIGYAPSLGGEILQQAMSRFSQLHPNVKVSIADSSSEQMSNGIRDGQFDLIIAVAVSLAGIEWIPLREEEFVTAVPLQHRLIKKRKIKPSDLDGEKLLLLSRADYPGYWSEVMEYFNEHRINAKVAGEFDGIGSLRLGLEANLGIALVAERARLGKKIKVKRMDPRPDPICVGVGYSADRKPTPWIQAFVSELQMASVK